MTDIDELLTTTELAAYLKRPKSWVLDNVYSLPGFKLGREWRFRASDIAEFIEDQVAA